MSEEKIAPWLRGIVDTLVGAAVLLKSAIPHRNRLAVILIDSALETACRAYLKHRLHIRLDDTHRHRENLMKITKAKLAGIDDPVWDTINYYYDEIRCDFYHQSAGKTLTDIDLVDYRETVEFVLDKAFGISTAQLVTAEALRVETERQGQAVTAPEPIQAGVRLSQVREKIDKVLIAVAELQPGTVDELNDYFRREGESLKLKQDDFTGIVARNRGSKKLFYYNKEARKWVPSGLGRFRLQQLVAGGQNG
jgi:hypothetical protein